MTQPIGSNFQLRRLQGLSVFTPPADRIDFPRRHPRQFRMLVRLDDALSTRAPFNHWGDFFILTTQDLRHE